MKKMQVLKEEFRKIYETSENPTEGMLSISDGWQNPPVFLPRVVKQSETGLEK
ncbi:uma4 protein [Microcystis aeruginosa TAIHU98]|uniref:Uma4 protein n=1 Tax=Microcystis aeruginosa TAIHU98 TaxID=1134457 RepID=L7E709_MICAE|nr:uma4 protein [Microcystis aeruginosa TAIHU98]